MHRFESDCRLHFIQSQSLAALLIFVALYPFQVLQPAPAGACSLFSFSSGDEVILARNLDWHREFPGEIVVNGRGIRKRVLPWKGNWPDSSVWKEQIWISRYGSVSFTCYGRDFIESGMNEAGLAVSEACLGAQYPPADDRPGISCAQWLQYQLDNYATVEEVLKNLNELKPDGEGWHYLLADREGGCAVIEYLEGEVKVFTGSEMPVSALTNTGYRNAIDQMTLDIRFGGSLDIGSGNDSYGRFFRIADYIRGYSSGEGNLESGFSFEVLDDVGSSETRRSIVYLLSSSQVLWRTGRNRAIRRLDLSHLDFSTDTPVRVLDIEKGRGELSSLLAEYTLSGNSELVRKVFSGPLLSPGRERILKKRGFSLDEVVNLIASHPQSALR
ncbi:MAG: linear amide C-N hydrolase [Candidatus Latescibacteria bacterium]|nr:linear amide C-N hydrolase [Candidatus Latescibacterota bacterium]